MINMEQKTCFEVRYDRSEEENLEEYKEEFDSIHDDMFFHKSRLYVKTSGIVRMPASIEVIYVKRVSAKEFRRKKKVEEDGWSIGD